MVWRLKPPSGQRLWHQNCGTTRKCQKDVSSRGCFRTVAFLSYCYAQTNLNQVQISTHLSFFFSTCLWGCKWKSEHRNQVRKRMCLKWLKWCPKILQHAVTCINFGWVCWVYTVYMTPWYPLHALHVAPRELLILQAAGPKAALAFEVRMGPGMSRFEVRSRSRKGVGKLQRVNTVNISQHEISGLEIRFQKYGFHWLCHTWESQFEPLWIVIIYYIPFGSFWHFNYGKGSLWTFWEKHLQSTKCVNLSF